ncbi:hypothetical protein LNO14_17585 [Klebsiella pneumoniae subsp. pneumoniae]|nr:hypothetical protein [Klebsiella pneumoniae subsp. pneumoniae]
MPAKCGLFFGGNMAGRSLGTLTIDLVAKVGGFVSGMDKAERASAKWSKQVQDDAAASSAALAGVGAAAVTAGLAVGAAGFQLLKSTSKQITGNRPLGKIFECINAGIVSLAICSGKGWCFW